MTKCPNCGGTRFVGRQVVHMDVICDGNGEWVSAVHEGKLEEDMYDVGRPFGPFACCECGCEIDELS